MNRLGADEFNVLRLTLHGRLVGYLAGFQDGRNVLTFADEYKSDAGRPTFKFNYPPWIPTRREADSGALVAQPQTAPHTLQLAPGRIIEGADRPRPQGACR